jgi:hypothetical protein
MTVSGAFNSATHASGDWDAVIHGTDCSGPWDTSGENEIEIELMVDHAYVKGVYVNPDELPSWGFFADVQEENFFGAIYGYMNGDSTFITLQGMMTSNDPPRFQGNVYFISNNGTAAADVGNFTWTAGNHEAAPAALLTLSSNILNVTNLGLARFSYAEIDKVDMLTGGDWNITRRVDGSTFGDQYSIDDTRMVEDGITYAGVVDNWDPDLEGLVGYFADPGGDFYGMLVEFDSVSSVFYIFIGNDTDLYGRYWFLEDDEEPTGGGDHFRAAADSMQVADTRDSASGAKLHSAVEKAAYENSGGKLEPMFTESRTQSAYQNLRRVKKP